MSGGYTKIFGSIVASSVWSESDSTRIVWISLLALADRGGEVAASVPGLARLANVSRDQCEEALRVLSSPDPDDSSGVAEGRRIERVQGGWRVVNYAAYREKGRGQDRTEYLTLKQRETRARRKQSVNKSTTVDRSQPIADANADADAEKEEEEGKSDLPAALDTPDFRAAWTEWLAYRREAKFQLWRDRTVKAKLGELAEIGSERAIAAIRKSIANGWKGIFPDSPTRGGKRSPASVPIAGHYSAEEIAAFDRRIRRHDATP